MNVGLTNNANEDFTPSSCFIMNGDKVFDSDLAEEHEMKLGDSETWLDWDEYLELMEDENE